MSLPEYLICILKGLYKVPVHYIGNSYSITLPYHYRKSVIGTMITRELITCITSSDVKVPVTREPRYRDMIREGGDKVLKVILCSLEYRGNH